MASSVPVYSVTFLVEQDGRGPPARTRPGAAGCLLPAETAARLGVRGALSGELAARPLRTYDDCDLALQRAVLVACGYAAQPPLPRPDRHFALADSVSFVCPGRGAE